MYELNKFNSEDDYIESIREREKGTAFEGFSAILEDHRPILRFYFEHRDEITPDFIGSRGAMFKEGVDIDTDTVIKLIRESDEFDVFEFGNRVFPAIEVFEYILDTREFLLDVLLNWAYPWESFVREFMEVRDIIQDDP